MMTAREFLKRRAKIAGERGRNPGWVRKATTKLLAQAGAVAVVSGTRVIAHRLASGEIVCMKQRFKDQEAAGRTLQMIQQEHQPRVHEPVRAYPCEHCKGWHLTSMA